MTRLPKTVVLRQESKNQRIKESISFIQFRHTRSTYERQKFTVRKKYVKKYKYNK